MEDFFKQQYLKRNYLEQGRWWQISLYFTNSWFLGSSSLDWGPTNDRRNQKTQPLSGGILKILRTLNSSKVKDIHLIPGSIHVLFPDIICRRFVVLANPKVPENLAKEWLPSLLPSKSPATMSAWISKNHTSTLINDLKHLDVFPGKITRCCSQKIYQTEK